MFYLGIDIGKLNHAAALIDHCGTTVAQLPTSLAFNSLLHS